MFTQKIKIILFQIFLLSSIYSNAQVYSEDFEDRSKNLNIIGRGICKIESGIFKSKDAYACFGDKNIQNYRFMFKARAPKDAEQVQIWAGFRTHNRFDRYVVGLKGGLQDDIYLSRMGYMGTDELLDISPLDFHPETGKWYNFKIEVCENRIRVFLNDETLPRIDVTDENADLAPSGPITLGGGWIETEFDDLRIEALSPNALKDVPVKTYSVNTTTEEKESKRKLERSAYKPVIVEGLEQSRTEINLDGNWLFLPEYEAKEKIPADPEVGDDKWHVMSVPNFWTPIRIWLHGETMNRGKFSKGVSDTYYQKETLRCRSYTFDYKKTAAAWYRQWIELPESISGKRIMLNFDAVSKTAEVYINGKLAASHIGMFGDFQVDGSKFFNPGKNLIAVKVSRTFANEAKSSASSNELNDATDFYYSSVRDNKAPRKSEFQITNNVLKELPHGFYGDNPAGIWQPVSLVITDLVKIEDVFIKPALDGAGFDVIVKNHSAQKASFNLFSDIVELESGHLFYSQKSVDKIELKPGEERVITYSVSNLKPHLWTPQSPNLYNFTFRLATDKGQELDAMTIQSGFRTFEVKNGLFELNGKPYWLRGGNHTPFALAPNDETLANSFYQIMKAGNIEITRTHTTPYNKLWINAADRNGIGISHEGTWPWLMIHDSMPDKALIDMWANEYLGLLKKYRNHPSIFFWTINNEMKFYDNEPDPEKRKEKMKIISDVVKRIREIDPTRPISFDSNYTRNVKKLGKDFYEGIDDGDIDDMHSYTNWYNHTLFEQFNGEFQRNHRNEGRPLISQEMSTGYPNNETGHPSRFYTLVHQNPQSLVGYDSYAFGNPESFLKVQSFITGELAEALRRSNDKASGILHFALLTWFRNVYDAQTIEPYPTYYAIKRALQPVLVSAELWGRNFYAGENIPIRICVVNDLECGRDLNSTVLHWQIESENGKTITRGKAEFPTVKHYKREWITPEIKIPTNIMGNKVKAKLKLRLTELGKEISANEYEILLANKEWTNVADNQKKIVLVDKGNTAAIFNALNINHKIETDLSSAMNVKADLIVLSGLGKGLTDTDYRAVKEYIAKGGKVLLLNAEDASMAIFPEYITGWIKPTEGDIVNMEMPESSVFDGIDLLELRYFNNNKREVPTVCHSALQVKRNDKVEELASHIKIHGYINGDMQQRSDYVKTIKGFPIIKIKEGKGVVLVSTMAHDKSLTDPVAARLLVNMINNMLK
jgi:hypothetical protein